MDDYVDEFIDNDCWKCNGTAVRHTSRAVRMRAWGTIIGKPRLPLPCWESESIVETLPIRISADFGTANGMWNPRNPAIPDLH